MRRSRYAGWGVVGGLLFTCLGAACIRVNSHPGEAPVPAAASNGLALAAASLAGSDDRSRIDYPPGHYPQLALGDGEMREVHSLLNVTRRLAYGDYVWDAQGVAAGQVWVRIDLARQMLSVFRGGDEIGTAVIIYGSSGKPTPVGRFHVLEKSENYYSRTYDAPMPYALRITDDGVALHASSVRDHSATHGCIGLPLEFARLLYNEMSRGDQVEILPAKDRAEPAHRID